jgi:hypothetical protein
VAVNINTAVFCDVTPCSLAEETACRHVPAYSSLYCVIPFPDVVRWRPFSLAKFMFCFRNISNYSGNCFNYLLRIILLFVCNSKKPKFVAQYSDYIARRTREESCFISRQGEDFSSPHSTPTVPLPTGVPEKASPSLLSFYFE